MTINECIKDIKNNFDCFETVFIDGEWGIGKTYPFEYANENCVLEDAIYISVFGISNINDLYEKFYDKLFILNEKNVDEITKVMNGVGKHGKHIIDILLKFKVFSKLKINNQNDKNNIEDLNLLGAFGTILTAIRNYFVKNINISNRIIIIDDIERKSNKLEMNEIEGFVNYIVKERKAKAILIGNTSKLNLENDDKQEIIKIKDKVCDRFYTIDEIDLNSVENILDIKAKEDNNIFEYISVNSIKNLRSLIKAKKHFETLKLLIKNEKYGDEFINLLYNTLKLISLNYINENVDKKLENKETEADEKIKNNEDALITKLIESRKYDVKTYIVFDEYKYEKIIYDIIQFVETYINDSTSIKKETFISLVKSLNELYKDIPTMFRSNEEINKYLEKEINQKSNKNIGVFEITTKFDNILELISKYFNEKREEVLKQYEINITNNMEEYINRILTTNINQYSYTFIKAGFPDIIHNKELEHIFDKVVNLKANEICIYYINNIISGKDIYENINRAKSIIKIFNLKDKIKYKVSEINCDLEDKVYNADEVNGIRKKLWFISIINEEYYQSIIKSIENKKYNNISASLIRDSIIQEHKYYFEK